MCGLSNDILLVIALCLDYKNLLRLERVNHHWRRVLRNNEAFLRKFCVIHWKKYRHYKALALDEAAWIWNHPR